MFSTTTELITKVMVVLVAWCGLLGVDALASGLWVVAQGTKGISRHASRAAIANEIALIKEFHESMVTMTGDRTRVADSCRVVGVVGV